MIYVKSSNLSQNNISELQKLLSICEAMDHLTYYSHLDADRYVFLYDNTVLVGYICEYKDDYSEITGLIHPSYRRKGFFSTLFNELKINDETSFVFSGQNKYPGFSECAISLNSIFYKTEYLMQFSGIFPKLPSPVSPHIGHLSTYEEDSVINIYDVYIEPAYRNMGYGYKLLQNALYNLKNCGKKIILQVTENNKPACNLYTTCGFKIIDSVTYYSRFV